MTVPLWYEEFGMNVHNHSTDRIYDLENVARILKAASASAATTLWDTLYTEQGTGYLYCYLSLRSQCAVVIRLRLRLFLTSLRRVP